MRRAGIALALAFAACSAPPAPVVVTVPVPAVVPVDPDAGRRERDQVHIVDGDVVRDPRGSTPGWRVRLRLFPGDPTASPGRGLAVAADGSVLAGASDGSLVGIDAGGTPRFQLGVRGPVTGLAARPDGDFAVTTAAGVVVLGPGGVVRSEPDLPPRPTMAYRARRNGIPAVAGSIVVVAPRDAWALDGVVLQHYDGKAWRRLAMPELIRMRSPVLSGRSQFQADRLERGAGGRLLLIGAQVHFSSVAPAIDGVVLRVFERDGARFREPRDLAAALAKTGQDMPSFMRPPLHATGPRGREVFCLLDACIARGLPPSFRPGTGAAPVPTGTPPWSSFTWAPDEMWSHWRGLVFAGDALWRLDEKGLYRDGKLVHGPLPEESNAPLRDLWASGGDDVWALTGDYGEGKTVTHWDGKTFTSAAAPVPRATRVWGTARDDVWIEGDGLAHFDGKAWRRVAGLPPAALSLGSAPGELLLGGLWTVTRDPGPQPDLEGAPAPAPPAAAPSRPLAVGPVDPSVHLERVTIDVEGGPPLRSALGVVEGPGGVVWLHDGHRLVEIDGARARLLYTAPPSAPLACQRCAAPSGAGQGSFLSAGLHTVAAGREAGANLYLPALLSVARAPSGAIWAVSASDDDDSPRAIVSGPNGARLVAGLPLAAYADVAPRADDDVWLAGGLGASRDEARAWPQGEGTLVHFDRHAFTRRRAPDGALLSVTATSPAEAWAVGVAGGVLHAARGAVEAFHLVAGDGTRIEGTLRAVAAGEGEVWIAGDRSTLLRWDGAALRRVDASVTGVEGALTAVVAPGAQPGWVVGPGGIWRVVRVR